LGKCRISGSGKEGPYSLAISLYLELFDLRIQRRTRDAELGGRPTWASNFSIARRQSRFDESGNSQS